MNKADDIKAEMAGRRQQFAVDQAVSFNLADDVSDDDDRCM